MRRASETLARATAMRRFSRKRAMALVIGDLSIRSLDIRGHCPARLHHHPHPCPGHRRGIFFGVRGFSAMTRRRRQRPTGKVRLRV